MSRVSPATARNCVVVASTAEQLELREILLIGGAR